MKLVHDSIKIIEAGQTSVIWINSIYF